MIRAAALAVLISLAALPAPARVAEDAATGAAPVAAPNLLAGIRPRPRPAVDVPAGHLSRALFSMREGDFNTALAAAEKAGPVARDIVEWHRLRAGGGRFDEVTAFLERRPDWPGLDYLRRRSEGSVPFGAREWDVVAFFRDTPPQTGQGSVALISALARLDDRAAAEAAVVRAWTTQTIGPGGERVLLESYGDLLEPHHEARLDMLLWANQRRAAERMYPLVSKGWKALAEARLTLRADKNGVDALVEAVPAALQDNPGLLFERFQWRARKGRNDAAIEIALAREGTEAALGRPGMWAGWRRGLARAEMRAGRADIAYRLAAAHGLTEGSSYADLEWLSGYLALTYLDDPGAALRHFQRFRAAVATPISLGRAGYWEGRAWAAMGNAEAAQTSYAFGAEWQTSFYGLLAAAEAGLPADLALTGRTARPDWRETSFADSSVLDAARLLHRAGERSLAERFFTHLAESLDEDEAGALGRLVLDLGEPHIAVMIGKRVAGRGLVVPEPYYPVVDLGASAENVEPALALAIARRESEFDPVVQSGVGARGLMQLMPATAREVSRSLGLSYSTARLTEDPVYNATLGTTYLSWLMDEFRGNPIFVAGAYNAGPGRIRRWVRENGDPTLGGEVEAMVDWIEHIPFRETRNYVMRVAESLPVYRARLSGTPDEQDFGALILQTVPGPGN
ncbi:MAG: lytic transglycosylase domain-containing protein [Paracoccaceae bacterium]|nr:lytic transglycosylase domain-containing protein [Paracoccaceae bacterium]